MQSDDENANLRMQSDDEKSDSEEEILVYVEFEGLVGSNVFNSQELHLDMIGIDTEHPIMQINGRVCLLHHHMLRLTSEVGEQPTFLIVFFILL